MKTASLGAAAIALLLASGHSLAADTYRPTDRFRGSVYLAGTNPPELIFTHENDYAEANGTTTLTHTYRKPDGAVATVERVTLERGTIASYEVDFANSTCGCELRTEGDSMLFAFTRDSSRKTARRPIQRDLLTGPTLNSFIAGNWDSLRSGQAAQFHFPAMELQQSVRFRMYRNGKSPHARDGVTVMTMDTANPLLRLLVDPVDLVVDDATRRLVEIHGKSLLEREVGGKTVNPVVDIYYEYERGNP